MNSKHYTNLPIAFHSFFSSCTHPMYESLAFVFSEVLVRIIQTDSHTLILISPISDLINNDDQHKAMDKFIHSIILHKKIINTNLSRTKKILIFTTKQFSITILLTSPPLIGVSIPCSFEPRPAPPHPIFFSS